MDRRTGAILLALAGIALAASAAISPHEAPLVFGLQCLGALLFLVAAYLRWKRE